ncbi:MAG: ABC transporter transmembrane domain-containing protein [Casimicrobiaceae bacterium]|nr:ABC transporter transmembrane domain-containing protein [Casimicrobiaceae bacterium]MDW8311877.1 ABC transporter transmembrane domain-containing protein [Burkholderiales bacterium]
MEQSPAMKDGLASPSAQARAAYPQAAPSLTDWARYRRLLRYAWPYRGRLLFALVALAVVSLVEPLITLSVGQIVDRGFGGAVGGSAVPTGALAQSFLAPLDRALSAVPVLAFPFLLVLVFAVRGAANFLGDLALHWVASRVVCDLRAETFAHLLRLPAAWFDTHPPAETTSRIAYDAQQVGQATAQALTALVQDSLKLLAALALMAAVSWRLMLVAFVVAPLVALVVRMITRRLRAASEALQTRMAELTRLTDEGLRHQRMVKLFSAFDWMHTRFAERTDAVRSAYMKQERANALAAPLIHLSVSLAIAAIVALAILEGQRGRMTAGDFFVFFTALLALLPPLKSLAAVNGVIQRGLAAAASLFTIADTPAEPQGSATGAAVKPQGNVPAIAFRDVSFRYPTREEEALRSVSFTVRPGERVAIVGGSGSGKSSVVALIAGLYAPQSGSVELFGERLTPESAVRLRAMVSLVAQEALLLDDTVAANIALGASSIDRERVRWAAEAAAAHEFIEALPHGYDTRVGDAGSLLSGGQRQRIAIARALYRQAPILVLDEATSALDSESETAVLSTLARLPEPRTIVHVAHRIASVRHADTILVFNDGRLVESGRYDELMRSKGYFRRLSELQAGENPAPSV